MDEVQRLLQQVRLLEQTAAEKSGCERQALQRRASEIKMEIIKLLPQRGQQQESKVPGLDYFDNKLDPAFGNYFSGDYLTDDMRDYFSAPKIQNFDNAPSAPKQEPAKTEDDSEAELRRRIFAALGIFY